MKTLAQNCTTQSHRRRSDYWTLIAKAEAAKRIHLLTHLSGGHRDVTGHKNESRLADAKKIALAVQRRRQSGSPY